MAVAHVVAEDTGVGFVPQPGQQLFFDEAAGCIHMIEGRMITAVALPHPLYGSGAAAAAAAVPAAAGSPAHGTPVGADDASAASGYESDSSIASSTARAFLVSEGPPVRHIRSSLDGAFTALHRSARLVELHCHATGCLFVETAGVPDKSGRRASDPQLLGFFWTAQHFVMVTGCGLEVHRMHPSLQGLRLEAAVPLQGVQWYTYSPETSMAILGFGSSGAKLQAIQFSKAGTLRLPLLDLTPPWGSPIRPVMAAAINAALEGFSAAREAPAALVGPDTCWVVVLYGRVFAAHHDRGAGLLRLYRLFRDATSLAHSYEVYAQQLELSVVDNVLLVHHIDTAVVMLIDILAGDAAPVSSPLPLAVPLPEEHEQHARGAGGLEVDALRGAAPGAQASADAAAEPAGGGQEQLQLAVAGPSALQLHYPNFLVDQHGGVVYRLQLDLRAIADSQSDHPRLLAFLQRRAASGAAARDAAGITLRVLRGLMHDQAPLRDLRTAFEVVNSFLAADRTAGVSSSSATDGRRVAAQAAQAPPRPVVAPQDAYSSAFRVLHAQQHVPPSYLGAALGEYAASCAAHGAVLPPPLAALYVDLLLGQGLVPHVAPLLLSHPQLDSALLAGHVEEAGAAGRLPGGAQLADQLMLRMCAHEARCRLLLRQGRAREALRLARRHRLAARPALGALEAISGADPLLLAAAQRCFGADVDAA